MARGMKEKNIRQTSKIKLTSILDKCRIWIEGRDENMKLSRKLPEAEFEIMKVVWGKEPPLTSTLLMEEQTNQGLESSYFIVAVVPPG